MVAHTYNPGPVPFPPSPLPSPSSAVTPPTVPAAPMFKCRTCGHESPAGNEFCDACGAPLDVQAPLASPPPYIAVWGPKSSGKTMFLFMLREEMRMRQTDWKIAPSNEEAEKFFGQLAKLKSQHRFAEATAKQRPEEMVLEFKRYDLKHNIEECHYVKVLDLPGEWYENRSLAVDQYGSNVVDDYLKKCKGLLCLVDPDARREDLSMYFDKLLMRLQMLCGQPTDKRLAVCLTKMDKRAHRLASGIGNPESWLCLKQPNEYTRCPHCQKSEEYVRRILGEGIMTEINKTFRRNKIRYFASSAIGLYPEPAGERSNSGIDWQGNPIIYEVQNIKPFGLFAPFCDWLFQD